MSNGSAIFKVIASLVWGIGTFIVVLSIKADGAQSGWSELLFCIGLLGLLQAFTFVSFILSAFNRGADEAINTVEEKIWVDRFGQVVHRESDAGSGCFVALLLWIAGILLTLLASALISPVIFIVNLCRAAHHFVPRKKIAVILDVLIVVVTIAGVVWGYGIADRAIQEREAKRRAVAAFERLNNEFSVGAVCKRIKAINMRHIETDFVGFDHLSILPSLFFLRIESACCGKVCLV